MVQCFEVGCNHASERQKCSFFRIPTSQKIRLKWQIVFDRRQDKNWTPHSRVCSCHFVDGMKENGPTIFHATTNITFKKKSARDLSEYRSQFSSILGGKGPMRQAPNNLAIQRLNPPAMKSLSLQQLSENGQSLFSHLQMNFASNTSAKSQGIKRPAPVSIAVEELGDIKPCKRELDAQESMRMEHSRTQVTTTHHGYPQVTSAQVVKSAQQNHLQLPKGRPNLHQATASHQNHLQMTTSHQSNPVSQSQQQGHSQMTIASQNHHHVTTGQLNHQVSVNQHNYPKTTQANNTGHPNPFQAPTSKLSHQVVTPGQKNHQNVTLGQTNHQNVTLGLKNHQNVTPGHSNPHQVTTGQTMITDQQSQPQIITGHPKRQQLSPAQLRFRETVPTRPNRIEGANGQQQSRTVLESLKTLPEAPDSRLKPSTNPDANCLTSTVALNPVRQMNKKTFTVSKHHSTVMSCLASLWKDSKLCDATIGNANFKIMVHKVVLLAISPKLLSQADIKANCFIRVNLPENVSQAALVAFSEYMYHGVLTLDATLLRQLRIIALQLGIRELELLCDTHLLYCDIQDPAVDSRLNLPETTFPSSLLGSTPEVSISTEPPHRISAEPDFTTVKQEMISGEFALNSSLQDLALPVKREPLDPTRNPPASAENILNHHISHNINNDLLNTNYQQQNLEAPVLLSGPYNDSFHSTSPEFEPPPLRQGAADDCLQELNDILQIQKFFKKSELSNFGPSDSFDKSAISLSSSNPSCVSENNDLVDYEIGYNKCHAMNATDNPMRPNCSDQSRKKSAELLTFQISDVRSVHQTIDLT